MDFKELAASEAAKASPPATVSALTIAGVPLSEGVYILTGLYILLQMFFLLRDKWWRDRDPKE